MRADGRGGEGRTSALLHCDVLIIILSAWNTEGERSELLSGLAQQIYIGEEKILKLMIAIFSVFIGN